MAEPTRKTENGRDYRLCRGCTGKPASSKRSESVYVFFVFIVMHVHIYTRTFLFVPPLFSSVTNDRAHVIRAYYSVGEIYQSNERGIIDPLVERRIPSIRDVEVLPRYYYVYHDIST